MAELGAGLRWGVGAGLSWGLGAGLRWGLSAPCGFYSLCLLFQRGQSQTAEGRRHPVPPTPAPRHPFLLLWHLSVSSRCLALGYRPAHVLGPGNPTALGPPSPHCVGPWLLLSIGISLKASRP